MSCQKQDVDAIDANRNKDDLCGDTGAGLSHSSRSIPAPPTRARARPLRRTRERMPERWSWAVSYIAERVTSAWASEALLSSARTLAAGSF